MITYDGTPAPEGATTRKINNLYYTVGKNTVKGSGQCYLMEDGKYYRENSPRIAWDNELGKYNFKSSMVEGYLNVGGTGWFTSNLVANYHCDNNLFAQGDEAIKMNGLFYDYATGLYSQNAMRLQMIQLPAKPSYKTLRNDVYSMSEYEIPRLIRDQARRDVRSSVFDKYFFDYNYGFEVETDKGFFPENMYYKLGCVPLKDGSIMGSEIVNLPYKGKLRIMEELFDATTKYTAASYNNSLHVNISGFKASPKFNVALYILYYRLQQEINTFIPQYKRDLAYFTAKLGGAKDHCKPMESLGITYKYAVNDQALFQKQITESNIKIFTFLNEGVYDTRFNIESRRHQKEGEQKWMRHSRYYALNLMNLYFGRPEESRVEFRVHSGTVNKYKSVIWTLITAAIVKYVEENADVILAGKEKISLDDVIVSSFNDETEVSNFLISYIRAYIASRSDVNTRIVMNHGDIYGSEFINDNIYTFFINNRSIFNYESDDEQRAKKPATKRPKL